MRHEKADNEKIDIEIHDSVRNMNKKWFRAIVYVRYYDPYKGEVRERHVGINAKRTHTDGELILKVLNYLESNGMVNGLRDILRIAVIYAGWGNKPLPPSIRRLGRKLDYAGAEQKGCENSNPNELGD